MCGIAGIVLLPAAPSLPDLRERLAAMAGRMYHRGPDDQGIAIAPDRRAGLANLRLAIRDISPAGHMPMANAEGTVWITYNGELYNNDELRPELERLGYCFQSQSDTETILHGYEAWGGEVVERLNGMFAFGILDLRPAAPCLFLARDRLGIKPLYFTKRAQTWLFASELSGLQASGLVDRELSPAGVVGYLLLGSVPNPLTIFQVVRALEPGHTLTIDLAGSDAGAEPQRYWRLPTDTVEPASYAEAVEQVRSCLTEAVHRQLVSDVPLGAFLSGGLDSSAIVALMRQATNGPIRTCSMVFEEAEYSEAPYARMMAQAVGAEHYERVITAGDVANELDQILGAMDQPTIDGVNTYFVSQTARHAGLTVALSGLGGDEVFGGYPNTFQGVPQMLRALQLVQRVPYGPALGSAGIKLLPDHRRWAKVQDALGRPPSLASAYLTRRGLFSPAEVKALVAPEMWEEATGGFDPIQHIAARAARNGHPETTDRDPFAWTSRAELLTYMHHQLLRDTDVMSMAHSLEVRVPFLDHKLVEAVLRLPARMKQGQDGPKPLLKAAIGNLLPPAIRDRRDKQGFTFPLDQWIQQLRQRLGEHQTSSYDRSLWLNAKAVNDLWALHAAGKVHWSRPWALAVLESWLLVNQKS